MSELCVVMPVGGRGKAEFAADTVRSIWFWCGDETQIFVIEDGLIRWPDDILEQPAFNRINAFPDHGRHIALYRNQCKGYQSALLQKDCKLVLKMDTDALIIRQRPQDNALRCFNQNPAIGSIGSFRQSILGPVEMHRYVHQEVRRLIDQGNELLRRAFRLARSHGYEIGNHCQGGGHFVRIEALRRMWDMGFFELPAFDTGLEDDFLFSLLLQATGYQLGELPIIGTIWQGLAMSPAELEQAGFKIIHSVEFYQNLDETAIRDYFNQSRINYDNSRRNFESV